MLVESARDYKDSVFQMSGAFPVNNNLLGIFPGTLIHGPPLKRNTAGAKMMNESNKADNSNSVRYLH